MLNLKTFLSMATASALAVALAVPAAAKASRASTVEQAVAQIRADIARAPTEVGTVVAITDNRNTLFVGARGYADIDRRLMADADTLFPIGSISKSMTGVAVMTLVDAGRFDLTAPIGRYLPDFRQPTRFAPITAHSLLTHTAGVPKYLTDVASVRYLATALNAWPAPYAPGAHYWYSNSGYQLLGYAAERADDMPFPLILRRRVFEPIGMTASYPQIDAAVRGQMAKSYRRAPDGALVAAAEFDYLSSDGAVVSTGPDMAAYARMLLNRGRTPQGRVMTEAAFARLATPDLANYAYGLRVADDGGVLWHSGAIAGFTAHLEVHVKQGFAVVFLGNGPLDRSLVDRVVMRLSSAFGGDAQASQFRGPSAHAPHPASDYAGRFRDGAGVLLTFSETPDGLMLKDDKGATPLQRLLADTWGAYLTSKGPRAFTFSRDSDGAVRKVIEGSATYAKDGTPVPTLATSPYSELVGRYKTQSPEGPDLRLIADGGQLMVSFLDEGTPPIPLVAAGDAAFRLPQPAHAPESLSFDSFVDGRAQRLLLSGVPLYRIDLP